MGFFDFLFAPTRASVQLGELAMGGRRRRRRKASARSRPAAPRAPKALPAPKAAASSATQDRIERIRVLAAKGDRRTEREDREFASLFRNPLSFGALSLIGKHQSDAARASETFHGTPNTIKVRGKEMVVVGTVEAVEYKAPRGSKRAGGVWRHEGGDQGDGKPRLRGRALLVADPRTGDLDIERGPAHFEPGAGIVG